MIYKDANTIHSPLFDTVKEYLMKNVNDTIYLFAPFVKVHTLERLVDKIQQPIILVTTWKEIDLLSGISELNLYEFCKREQITLYINNRIHLKVYSAGLNSMILSTGNISKRGLENIPNHNLEMATYIASLCRENRSYLQEIINDAILIDDSKYEKISIWLKKQETPQKIIIKTTLNEILVTNHDLFLISALPMTQTIELLETSYQILNDGKEIIDSETRDCVFHDLENYCIKWGLNKIEFRSEIQKKFFKHPFIQRIDEFIAPDAYFGSIKEWIQINCTTVPIPSRRDLTGNIQVLLKWFESLGNGKYTVNIPHRRSQRISKTYKGMIK